MNGKAERAMLAHWLVRTSRAALFHTRPALICRAGIFFVPGRLFFAGPAFFLPARLFSPGRFSVSWAGFLFLPDRLAQTGPVVKSRGFKAHPGFWPAKPALCTALVTNITFITCFLYSQHIFGQTEHLTNFFEKRVFKDISQNRYRYEKKAHNQNSRPKNFTSIFVLILISLYVF